jgi:uncharacterized membrane protein YGL010W
MSSTRLTPVNDSAIIGFFRAIEEYELKTLTEQLSKYASYHRDDRNIATHFVGIPMIVVAVITLLSRPSFPVDGLILSPGVLAALVACTYYLVLDLSLGAIMTVLMGLGVWFGAWAAGLTTAVWLTLGLGGFVVGWIIQFVGHYYEGRKPAFVDDIMGLAIGPLFVVAEALFMMGFFAPLKAQVEGIAGPVRRKHVHPSAG